MKRENQQLRAELKIFDPIRNLFSRQKAIFRNAVYPISSYMNRFIMLLLCQGLSGTSIHKFLSLLFNEYTDCFTRDEPNMIFKMPSLPHICNLRKAIGPLCNQQERKMERKVKISLLKWLLLFHQASPTKLISLFLIVIILSWKCKEFSTNLLYN